MLITTDNIQSTKIKSKTWTYLLCSLLFALGSYILTPFYAIYVSDSLGFGLAFAGTLISVKVVSQRGLSIVGGFFADKYGSNLVAMLGVLARSLSYFLLVFYPTASCLLLSALLNGVGSAFFQPSVRKLLFTSYRDNDELLRRVIVYRSIALNVGTALGPVIGSLLISNHFSTACLCISIIYLLSSFIFIGNLNSKKENNNIRYNFSIKIIGKVFKSELINVMKIQFLFIFIYSHLDYLLPVFIKHSFGTKMIAVVFMVNSIVVIFFQNRITKMKIDKSIYTLLPIFFFGVTYIAGVLSKDYTYISYFVICISIILFTIFEIICSFTVDYLLTKESHESISGFVFGLASVVAAIAYLIANKVNYWLYHFLDFNNLWLTYVGICSIAFILYNFIKIRKLLCL